MRRTLDGTLVLNHDGFLERLTDGIGEVEQSYYAELQFREPVFPRRTSMTCGRSGSTLVTQ